MSFEIFGRTFYFLKDDIQREKALNMIKDYILKPEILALLLFLLVYFILRCYARILKKEKFRSMLLKISPWVYLTIILSITLLNRGEGVRDVRLVPDSWIASGGRVHESAILGFMFNLALYMPFGYLLYKYMKVPQNGLITVFVVVLSSVLTEALQYIFARGVTAVDDLLANVIGGLMGLVFAILVHKIKDRKQKRESVE